jgi:hypothetical protein
MKIVYSHKRRTISFVSLIFTQTSLLVLHKQRESRIGEIFACFEARLIWLPSLDNTFGEFSSRAPVKDTKTRNSFKRRVGEIYEHFANKNCAEEAGNVYVSVRGIFGVKICDFFVLKPNS